MFYHFYYKIDKKELTKKLTVVVDFFFFNDIIFCVSKTFLHEHKVCAYRKT